MAATNHTPYLHLPIWEEGNITDFFELNGAFTTIDANAKLLASKELNYEDIEVVPALLSWVQMGSYGYYAKLPFSPTNKTIITHNVINFSDLGLDCILHVWGRNNYKQICLLTKERIQFSSTAKLTVRVIYINNMKGE